MKKITKKDFIQLYNEYKENGYWNKEWGLTNKEETELADAFKTVYSAEPSGDYNEEEFFDEQFSLYNKGELSTITVMPKTINDISAADFERLMWEYEASGDKAFGDLMLTEKEQEILATALTLAMHEYNADLGADSEDAPWYGEDKDYTEFINGQYEYFRSFLSEEK